MFLGKKLKHILVKMLLLFFSFTYKNNVLKERDSLTRIRVSSFCKGRSLSNGNNFM